MSLKPVIAGSGFYDKAAGSSSSSNTGLPTWTFQNALNGAPTTGKFTTDNAQIGSTNFLNLHINPGFSSPNWQVMLGDLKNLYMVLTDSGGKSSVLDIQSLVFNTTYFTYSISITAGDTTNWSGAYALSMISDTPSIGTVLAASLITPAVDGTYSPVNSITISNGIITAIS